MRTKNAARITPKQSAHMASVKALPCSVCNERGGFAHHINQGQHYTTVALCFDCHQGAENGWHGRRTMWRIMKLDELGALDITIDRLGDNHD